MSKRPFLQKLLNVRASEWKVVTQLFWLQFFMGTGIAFFFTASFTHFLEKFSASQLAWVMIISSPLLFVVGWIFNKLEHRYSLVTVGTIIITSMAVSILLFQVSSNWIKDDWFYYLTFAWYYVLYLASNLSFWSITSTLFDVRQSKRLFAVISGGDIPAKFIGYTIAYFFVKTIGSLNMMWPAFAFMLASLPFLYQISRSGVIHHHDHHGHHEHHEHAVEYVEGKGFWVFIKRYTLNRLIRRLAMLTFIISVCLAIINYALYSEVKEANHDDKDLSKFIILFMAGSQIVALLVKIVFTGRIVTSIGIKKALLITPFVLSALLFFIILSDVIIPGEKIFLYTFGIAAIAIEVLRTAITNPVFLTVMQPLDLNERSKAHAIVKGIMDPFAFLIAGLLLILINTFDSKKDLLTLSYILAFLTICWILSIILVNKSYHYTLVKAISSRFFSQDEFRLSDDEIQEQVLQKIKTGNESEVINILQMLNSQINSDSKELIVKLLDHPSDNIKKATLQLIQTRNIKGAEEKLKELSVNAENKEVKYLAVQLLCYDNHNHKHYLNDREPELRAAALTGMLLSNSKESKKDAEEVIGTLLNSIDIADNKLAIAILNNVKEQFSHPGLVHLFHAQPGLRVAAFKTIGEGASPDLLENAATYLNENLLPVLDALHSAGERSIPVIEKRIHQHDLSQRLKEKLIATLGKIGGEKAQTLLLKLLNEYSHDAGVIVKALHRSHYKATHATHKKLEEIAFAYILYGIELLYMQNMLEKENENYSIMASSLSIELIEIRDVLICLFGCLYDHEKAFKIKQGLDIKKKENVANSMELIEMIVKKDLAIPFNKLFEPGEIEHRFDSLKNLLPKEKAVQVEEIFSKILSEQPINYTAWTKACSMYISKKTRQHINPDLIKKFVHSDNLLLQETALYAQ